MTRQLILCADDFGQSRAIDRGILRLVAAGRLSAVSCMCNGPAWALDAQALVQAAATAPQPVSLGLHLNLSEGQALAGGALEPFPRLLLRAQLRLLPAPAVRAELAAQLHAFEQATGQAPAHLDGHQHVHHLPGVREAVLELARARPGLRVRHTGAVAGPGAAFKRAVIAATGGRALGRVLAREGRAANTLLLGTYGFEASAYRNRFQAWLSTAPARGALLYCHPGEADTGGHDPIGAARVQELDYLGNEAFSADLQAAGVALTAAF